MGGREAELWTKKILNPPSLADRLGSKADKAVVLVRALPSEIVAAAKGARIRATVETISSCALL